MMKSHRRRPNLRRRKGKLAISMRAPRKNKNKNRDSETLHSATPWMMKGSHAQQIATIRFLRTSHPRRLHRKESADD
jgi:hypothetical protein